jgi:hypothetical protein
MLSGAERLANFIIDVSGGHGRAGELIGIAVAVLAVQLYLWAIYRR